MNKVFIVHGYKGTPNGGWRPWLMQELEKQDVYACALAMPNPDQPKVHEWVAEISRHVDIGHQVYLVGHSLGVPAILHYLQRDSAGRIQGAVLVSGPAKSMDAAEIEEFVGDEFDFQAIKKNCGSFTLIHGDDDPLVPLSHAEYLRTQLDGRLIVIPNGKHLNGGAGVFKLQECLSALNLMFG